tara:strand:- start:3649 stop:3999 length:351 start_codon:yes stop_codon:yes gene_type:complete
MNYTRISAILAFLAIALGAFGAHGLEKHAEIFSRIEFWETASHYHLIHAVALFAIAWRAESVPKGPWICLAVGILVFSGCLYLYCLTGAAIFGAITPIGGVAFLAGWLWFAIRAKS